MKILISNYSLDRIWKMTSKFSFVIHHFHSRNSLNLSDSTDRNVILVHNKIITKFWSYHLFVARWCWNLSWTFTVSWLNVSYRLRDDYISRKQEFRFEIKKTLVIQVEKTNQLIFHTSDSQTLKIKCFSTSGPMFLFLFRSITSKETLVIATTCQANP